MAGRLPASAACSRSLTLPEGSSALAAAQNRVRASSVGKCFIRWFRSCVLFYLAYGRCVMFMCNTHSCSFTVQLGCICLKTLPVQANTLDVSCEATYRDSQWKAGSAEQARQHS